jgi:ABC-2 type transport system ATP-binding protein
MATLPVLAEGLRKRYGPANALEGFDLAVPEGSVCGLLGPNGAGKTTAVRILATLLRPDGGRARVAGFDVVRQAAQVRYRIGLLGQHAAVDEVLGGRQNLVLFGRLHHLGAVAAGRRADELLERFGLGEVGGKPVKQYSGGMRRRLDLAASLILAPPVLFLDEADQLADRISVIDHGRVIAEGSPDQLKSRLGGDRIDVVVHRADQLAATAAILGRAAGSGAEAEADPDTRRVSVPVRDRVAALTEAAWALRDAGVAVEDVALRRPTLDEVFLHLTGHPIETADERPQEVTA